MQVRKVIKSNNFEKAYNKIDKSFRLKLDKLLIKILENPEIGEPMKYGRKGTREVYMKPFRISYSLEHSSLILYFLDLYHKKKQ